RWPLIYRGKGRRPLRSATSLPKCTTFGEGGPQGRVGFDDAAIAKYILPVRSSPLNNRYNCPWNIKLLSEKVLHA
ncbi:MAG TPA: hypothetical protein VF359_04925, partial [Anaerolineales bacterium]